MHWDRFKDSPYATKFQWSTSHMRNLWEFATEKCYQIDRFWMQWSMVMKLLRTTGWLGVSISVRKLTLLQPPKSRHFSEWLKPDGTIIKSGFWSRKSRSFKDSGKDVINTKRPSRKSIGNPSSNWSFIIKSTRSLNRSGQTSATKTGSRFIYTIFP